jgi:hypothetical protein
VEDLMIQARALLTALRSQLKELEADFHQHGLMEGVTALRLQQEWQAERDAQWTAMTYQTWLDDRIAQAASAWLLGTAFVRFCEDNTLIEAPFIAGAANGLSFTIARQQAYFRQHPDRTDRDWIVAALDALSTSAATFRLFDSLHSLMRQVPISNSAAQELLAFWRQQDAAGQTVHDFTDPDLDTGFLADLYADLSDSAKKSYALVSTPNFVADLILDYTVNKALETFGSHGLRIIDPACGSGTFLIGTFHRILTAQRKEDPNCDSWELIEQALASVHGVDKNPIAAAIARFRLLIAAIKDGKAKRLADVPELPILVATGDSLIPRNSGPFFSKYKPGDDLADYMDPAINMLGTGSYDVVVCNPPYITVRDKGENAIYHAICDLCRGRYPLTVPFIRRFFELARDDGSESGFVGTLVSNSFMKRDFGRPLVEEFLSGVELTHVIDTSGAYIPGHGTPTVILLGRRRSPLRPLVRTVLGVRGEPTQPIDPATGVVWKAIVRQIEVAGSQSEWIMAVDRERAAFAKHPWSLTGITASNMLTAMEYGTRLHEHVRRIGYYANTGSDEAFIAPAAVFRRIDAEDAPLITIITGSEVRDWCVTPQSKAFFPGEDMHRPVDITNFPRHLRRLWPCRTILGMRRYYASQASVGESRTWYGWHHVTKTYGAHPWSLTFPWVATHPHFVLLSDPVAPLQSAPVIKLADTASEDEFLELTALLNSSAVCFWLKQYSHAKGSPRADQLRAEESWECHYEFTSTCLEALPLPSRMPDAYGRTLDILAQRLNNAEPAALCSRRVPTRDELDSARTQHEQILRQMIALQEELDWHVYMLYGLLDSAKAPELMAGSDNMPELKLGQRAFEIVLARRAKAGEADTQWFARHRSTPITEIPHDWPEEYRKVVARRIEAIEHRHNIEQIERPEYKRRWQNEPWEQKERDALRNWLLERCEDRNLWYVTSQQGAGQPRPMTVSRLADRLRCDADVIAVARLLSGPDADLAEVLKEIIVDEHVPYLAQLRYSGTGLLKRLLWEKTWDLQREEDRTGQRMDIDVPPKYRREDFLKASYWNQRGKLDLPKERFISYPLASPDGDDSLLLGWAGWDHQEQARALLMLIEERAVTDKWDTAQMAPLFAGLLEVMRWVRQWHDEIDPELGTSPARALDAYLTEQWKKYKLAEGDLRSWRPPQPKRGRPPKVR